MNAEQHEHEVSVDEQPMRAGGTNAWLWVLLVVALAAAGIGFGYAYNQNQSVSQLTAKNNDLNSSISQMQSQMDALNAKIADLAKPPAPPEPAANSPEAAKSKAAAKHAKAKRAADDKRFKQLQSQLDDQQKQLKQTEDDVASARSDFDSRLGSTRDELNGSIARTHDELVALEKRGERSYFEFDLNKSKQLQHVGPIQLSLRKADAKHKHYNLAMLVDDNLLTKKNVNLYEPVWIHETGDHQPVQIVVNSIQKNHVHGYVSAPKYRESEMSKAAPAPAPEAPATGENAATQPPSQQPPQ